MADRRANAPLFGFDFQVNAAIVLMLENITDAVSLQLEGANEDIEIKLQNNHYILAQAKSVVKSSSDFRNVRSNLKKSLESLSEAQMKVKTDKLIMITNSPNPLNDKQSANLFWGMAHRDFSTLPLSSQKIITDYLGKESNFDTNKFMIQVLPFETDNPLEKYKAVMQCIDDFIGKLKLNTPGLGQRLHEIWRLEILNNGTNVDESITLSKKDFIWPIIVIETDISNVDENIQEEFDESLYEEIAQNYKELINSRCEKYEFVTRVLYDYSNFKSKKSFREKSWEFAESEWKKYANDFSIDTIDDDILEGLTKIILYSIVRRRYDIDKIKQGVCL